MTALTLLLALSITQAAPENPAASAPRESPPPPGPVPKFELPPLRRLSLDNGLEVTLVPVGSVPKATVTLAVRVGSGEETPAQAGLSRFVADMLVEGTTSRSAGEIAARAARWGGSVETDVTADESLVGGTVLSEFTADLVRLVADVAMNPAFPEKELERVRQDRIREVTIARTTPQTLAQERFLALTYPGHGYGRLLPSVEALQAHTAEQVRNFHGATWSANRAHLYVAGRFDAASTEKAIREAFSGWKAGAPPTSAPATPASRRAVHLVERAGAVQSSIFVGLPVLDPRNADYLKLVVTNTLLGGYFSSRMTANLREAKGYTYSPISIVSVRGGAPGFWAQIADVTTAVTGASLTEIFSEVERLRTEAPPEAEVRATQSYLAGQFVLQVSRRQGLIDRLRFVNLYGLPDTWLEDYVENIRAVTPADVQAMARTWLDAEKMTVVVVGDRGEVEDQVKGVGEVVVSPAVPAAVAPGAGAAGSGGAGKGHSS
jgi:predicted Zn-dependent peptidase